MRVTKVLRIASLTLPWWLLWRHKGMTSQHFARLEGCCSMLLSRIDALEKRPSVLTVLKSSADTDWKPSEGLSELGLLGNYGSVPVFETSLKFDPSTIVPQDPKRFVDPTT